MLSLLDIAERTQTGPKMSEMDWNMGLFQKMTELTKRYDIRVPDMIDWFNTDDALAERAFQAGVDFLAEAGLYCVSTGRVIRFTRDEVLTAIREAPDVVEMGEGADRRAFKQHQVEGREPLNVCPGHHAPFTADLGPLVVESFARIPRTDFLEGFNFTAVDGREVFGLPMEAYATRRQMDYMRAGIRKANRPGLAIVLYPINTRIGALLAALDPDYGLRRTDGMLLSVLPDLKMEHDLLTAAIVGHDYGLFTLSGSFSIVGGFCGGIEGAIVEGVAKPLAAMLVYRDYINYVGVEDSRGVSLQEMAFQPVSWARSVVLQALNTFSHTISMAWIIPTAGPGTETNLIETAIRSIEAQINGGNLYAIRHSRAQMNAGQTPLEAEWMIEVADATLRAGLDRSGAGRICCALNDKLLGRKPEPGRTIQECYDLIHHRPLPDYEALYLHLKDELVGMGLDFA
jgi:methylamine---corrinoid protein Co-methyltransferase